MSSELERRDKSPSPYTVTGDYFSDVPTVLDKFTTLMEHLPTHRRPVRHSISYEFLPRAVDQLSYPRQVAEHMSYNQLAGIYVDVTQEEDGAPSTTFEFVFDRGSGHKESIYASRIVVAEDEADKSTFPVVAGYPLIRGEAEKDVVIDSNTDTIRHIDKLPNNELNAYLFSLTDNSVDAMLAYDDPYGHNIVDATTMTTSLAKSAIEEVSDVSFELNDEGNRTLSYRMTKQGPKEALNNLIFQYETGSDRKISVMINQEEGFSIIFHTTDSATGLNALYQDEGDYLRLVEILDEEIAKLEN